MILGMGIDLVDVGRFQTQLDDPASHFTAATFTRSELAYSNSAPSGEPGRHLAVRFAAKEATIKALDHACARAGVHGGNVDLKHIEVLRDELGRPQLQLHGSVAVLASTLGVDRTWLSLTHDGDQALASVVVERLA